MKWIAEIHLIHGASQKCMLTSNQLDCIDWILFTYARRYFQCIVFSQKSISIPYEKKIFFFSTSCWFNLIYYCMPLIRRRTHSSSTRSTSLPKKVSFLHHAGRYIIIVLLLNTSESYSAWQNVCVSSVLKLKMILKFEPR